MVDRDRRHLGHRFTDLLEEDFEIAGPRASTELDDGDGLAGSIQRLASERPREIVTGRELGCRHPVAVARPGVRAERPAARRAALGAGVEAEDPGHDVAQLLRHADLTLAAPIGPGRVVVDL